VKNITYSLGAANSLGVWVKTLFQSMVGMPRALFEHCRDKREGSVVLPRVTFFVTTRCTLNCDKCCAQIPDLRNRRDIPLDELMWDLEKLLASIDYIYAFILSGGEPFLHPDLYKIIQLCADSDKIGDISLQSNGTIVPGAKVLTALREAKVLVKISRYPAALQRGVEELKCVLKENGVRYTHVSSTFWDDTISNGQRQEGSARRRFSVCISQLCLTYLNGKFYRCSTAAFLTENERIPCHGNEYIDLRVADSAAFRAQWQEMMKKRALTACSYCLGQTYKTPKIPVAVQRVPRK